MIGNISTGGSFGKECGYELGNKKEEEQEKRNHEKEEQPPSPEKMTATAHSERSDDVSDSISDSIENTFAPESDVARHTNENKFFQVDVPNPDELPYEENSRARIIATNVVADNPKEFAQAFKAIAKQNPNIKKPVVIMSISADKRDKVSAVGWYLITKDILEKMGYKDSLFLVVQHRDREHDHIHILTSKVDILGNTVKDSNSKRRLEKVIREIEEKYNLHKTQASAKTTHAALSRREIEYSKKTGNTPIRKRMQMSIDTTLKENPSVPEFVARLKEDEISVMSYFKSKEQISGISFYHAGMPVAGSRLGKSFGWNQLQQRGLDFNAEQDVEFLRETTKTTELLKESDAQKQKTEKTNILEVSFKTDEEDKENIETKEIIENIEIASEIVAEKQVQKNLTPLENNTSQSTESQSIASPLPVDKDDDIDDSFKESRMTTVDANIEGSLDVSDDSPDKSRTIADEQQSSPLLSQQDDSESNLSKNANGFSIKNVTAKFGNLLENKLPVLSKLTKLKSMVADRSDNSRFVEAANFDTVKVQIRQVPKISERISQRNEVILKIIEESRQSTKAGEADNTIDTKMTSASVESIKLLSAKDKTDFIIRNIEEVNKSLAKNSENDPLTKKQRKTYLTKNDLRVNELLIEREMNFIETDEFEKLATAIGSNEDLPKNLNNGLDKNFWLVTRLPENARQLLLENVIDKYNSTAEKMIDKVNRIQAAECFEIIKREIADVDPDSKFSTFVKKSLIEMSNQPADLTNIESSAKPTEDMKHFISRLDQFQSELNKTDSVEKKSTLGRVIFSLQTKWLASIPSKVENDHQTDISEAKSTARLKELTPDKKTEAAARDFFSEQERTKFRQKRYREKFSESWREGLSQRVSRRRDYVLEMIDLSATVNRKIEKQNDFETVKNYSQDEITDRLARMIITHSKKWDSEVNPKPVSHSADQYHRAAAFFIKRGNSIIKAEEFSVYAEKISVANNIEIPEFDNEIEKDHWVLDNLPAVGQRLLIENFADRFNIYQSSIYDRMLQIQTEENRLRQQTQISESYQMIVSGFDSRGLVIDDYVSNKVTTQLKNYATALNNPTHQNHNNENYNGLNRLDEVHKNLLDGNEPARQQILENIFETMALSEISIKGQENIDLSEIERRARNSDNPSEREHLKSEFSRLGRVERERKQDWATENGLKKDTNIYIDSFEQKKTNSRTM